MAILDKREEKSLFFVFVKWLAKVETQSSWSLKIFKTNGGGQFKSN